MNGYGGGWGGGNRPTFKWGGGQQVPDAASHFGARLRRSGVVNGQAPAPAPAASGGQGGGMSNLPQTGTAWQGSPLWRNPALTGNMGGGIGQMGEGHGTLPTQRRNWGPEGPAIPAQPKNTGIIPPGPAGGPRPPMEGGPFGPPRPIPDMPGDPAGPRGGVEVTPFENRPNPGDLFKGDPFAPRPTGGFDTYAPKPTDIMPHGPWGGGFMNEDGSLAQAPDEAAKWKAAQGGNPQPIGFEPRPFGLPQELATWIQNNSGPYNPIPPGPPNSYGPVEGSNPPQVGPKGYTNPMWARLAMRNMD